jgi:hypothetical protein
LPPIEQLFAGHPQSAGQVIGVSPQSHLPLPHEEPKLPEAQICPGVPGWQVPAGMQVPLFEQLPPVQLPQSAAQLVAFSPQLQVASPQEAAHAPFLQTMPVVPGWQVPCG